MPSSKANASFIEPMLCLSSEALPQGKEWQYELKLDGYRAIAFKHIGKVRVRSRNDKDFSARYPGITEALRKLPEDTIIDGELVAFDEAGRPSFNRLQNYGSSQVPIYYYTFDLLMLAGRDLTSRSLEERRALLRSKVLAKLEEPIRFSPTLDAPLDQLIASVREQGFEVLSAAKNGAKIGGIGRSQ